MNNKQGFFPIVCVTREEIADAAAVPQRVADALSDKQMRGIVSALANAWFETGFWDLLGLVVDEVIDWDEVRQEAMGSKQQEFFTVLRMCREDLCATAPRELSAKIQELTDDEMQYIASKVGDHLMTSYWDVIEGLRADVLERVLGEKFALEDWDEG